MVGVSSSAMPGTTIEKASTSANTATSSFFMSVVSSLVEYYALPRLAGRHSRRRAMIRSPDERPRSGAETAPGAWALCIFCPIQAGIRRFGFIPVAPARWRAWTVCSRRPVRRHAGRPKPRVSGSSPGGVLFASAWVLRREGFPSLFCPSCELIIIYQSEKSNRFRCF